MLLTFILLLLLFLIIIIHIKKNNKQLNEKFTGLFEQLSKITDPTFNISNEHIKLYKPPIEKKNTNIENTKKKEIKYIYIIETKLVKSAYPGDFKYVFYDKNRNNYMMLSGNLKNKNEIKIFDINDNIIGGLLYERYSNFIFFLKILSEDDNNKNINIEFYNNYKNAKIYLDNDDKEFYIYKNKTNKTLYDIFLFKNKKIGKINGGKIIVYEDFKIYLNVFGLAYILFENY